MILTQTSLFIFAHSEMDQKAFSEIVPILLSAYLQDHALFGQTRNLKNDLQKLKTHRLLCRRCCSQIHKNIPSTLQTNVLQKKKKGTKKIELFRYFITKIQVQFMHTQNSRRKQQPPLNITLCQILTSTKPVITQTSCSPTFVQSIVFHAALHNSFHTQNLTIITVQLLASCQVQEEYS